MIFNIFRVLKFKSEFINRLSLISTIYFDYSVYYRYVVI